MFRRLLIANRGEIAIRVARTAREMGIRTIGVYSEADRSALHRSAMDETLLIGGALPADSYLNIENVLQAARAACADAIHPGYGFLSENPIFSTRGAQRRVGNRVSGALQGDGGRRRHRDGAGRPTGRTLGSVRVGS